MTSATRLAFLLSFLLLPSQSQAATLVPIDLSLEAFETSSSTTGGPVEFIVEDPGETGSATLSIFEEGGRIIFEQIGDYTGRYGFGGNLDFSFVVPDLGAVTTSVLIRSILLVDEDAGLDLGHFFGSASSYFSAFLGTDVAARVFSFQHSPSLPDAAVSSLDAYIAGDEITTRILAGAFRPQFFKNSSGAGAFHTKLRIEAFAVVGDHYPTVPEPGRGWLALAAFAGFARARRGVCV